MGQAERQFRRSKLSNRQDVVYRKLLAVENLLKAVMVENAELKAFLKQKYPNDFLKVSKGGVALP